MQPLLSRSSSTTQGSCLISFPFSSQTPDWVYEWTLHIPPSSVLTGSLYRRFWLHFITVPWLWPEPSLEILLWMSEFGISSFQIAYTWILVLSTDFLWDVSLLSMFLILCFQSCIVLLVLDSSLPPVAYRISTARYKAPWRERICQQEALGESIKPGKKYLVELVHGMKFMEKKNTFFKRNFSPLQRPIFFLFI